ncbi:GNAT family N-acetyltransferase [Janthinobacterium sp. Mn2066]|uniref:GNAT family N-acetyltransferase n=1 Tax=Janthinobacterium sp. Mn2066 TaxID=3395264 RepID=UPI003BE4F602
MTSFDTGGMPSFHVRPLTTDDTPAYRALRLAGIGELPATFCTTYALESSLPLAHISQRLQANRYQIIFGAFDGDHLVAIAGLRREPIAVVHDKASVWGVYVAPVARGKGAGWQLLQATIEHACAIPELAKLRLAVAQDNHAALSLYLRCGFTLDEGALPLGMLQMQLLLPRPAIAETMSESDVFMKINGLRKVEK